jgi:hypothetical protein
MCLCFEEATSCRTGYLIELDFVLSFIVFNHAKVLNGLRIEGSIDVRMKKRVKWKKVEGKLIE